MKRPMVISTLTHAGRKFYQCVKGNGHGGCAEKKEITEDVYDYLLKNQDAQNLTPKYMQR